MKYDFITAPNRRNSGSSKWEGMKGLNPMCRRVWCPCRWRTWNLRIRRK